LKDGQRISLRIQLQRQADTPNYSLLPYSRDVCGLILCSDAVAMGTKYYLLQGQKSGAVGTALPILHSYSSLVRKRRLSTRQRRSANPTRDTPSFTSFISSISSLDSVSNRRHLDWWLFGDCLDQRNAIAYPKRMRHLW
jgi:hypothetical protein